MEGVKLLRSGARRRCASSIATCTATRSGAGVKRVKILQSRRRALHRRRARRAARGRDRRARRLLRRRHEQARPHHRARQCRAGRRREHDVGHDPRARALPPRPPALPRMAACSSSKGDAALRCGISLKGGDIVVGGSVGSFSGVHGAGRAHRDLRRCRRCAGRFAVRSGDLRARRGALARRRCALRADDRRRSRGRARVAGHAPASSTTRRAFSASRRRRACITGTPMPTRNIEDMDEKLHARRIRRLRPARHRLHPARVGHGPVRNPRPRRQAHAAASSTISCSSAPRCRAIRSRAIARSAPRAPCSARASRPSPSSSPPPSPSPA